MNLKYQEQVPTESSQKTFRIGVEPQPPQNIIPQGQAPNQPTNFKDIVDQSHSALQSQISPQNQYKQKGEFHGRQATIQQVTSSNNQYDLQSPHTGQGSQSFLKDGNNGAPTTYPSSFRWSNYGAQNEIDKSQHQQHHDQQNQYHHRVQDHLRHFDIQQHTPAVTTSYISSNNQQQNSQKNQNVAQLQKGSQSQMQHFQKKSVSVQLTPHGGGSQIVRVANTGGGMMPSIHKNNVAFPDLENPGNQSNLQKQQPHQISSEDPAQGSGSTNLKNYNVQVIMQQNPTSDRNQILLVSDPDLLVNKGPQQSFQNTSYGASIGQANKNINHHKVASPLAAISSLSQDYALAPQQQIVTSARQTQQPQSPAIHKKTNSLTSNMTSPAKRSLVKATKGPVTGTTTTGVHLPAAATTTNTSNNIIINNSVQPN